MPPYAAVAHERDPAQAKCTMLHPNGARHLRGVIASSQVASMEVQSVPGEECEQLHSQQPTSPHQQQAALQPSADSLQHSRQQRLRPTGDM